MWATVRPAQRARSARSGPQQPNSRWSPARSAQPPVPRPWPGVAVPRARSTFPRSPEPRRSRKWVNAHRPAERAPQPRRGDGARRGRRGGGGTPPSAAVARQPPLSQQRPAAHRRGVTKAMHPSAAVSSFKPPVRRRVAPADVMKVAGRAQKFRTDWEATFPVHRHLV